MFQSVRKKYEHTIYAGYIGYITQAIVNNFAPLLFLTFSKDYGLTLDKITLITTVNFFVQLCVDLLSAKVMDRIGYRKGIVCAHLFAALGLAGMAVLPDMTGDPYVGLMISIVLYAIGGGIIEVLISPIIESCPTEKKEAAMSLLHSFYCWGHVFVVLASTAFFQICGVGNWKILACVWALLPLFNMLYFALVPLYPVVEEHEALSLKGLFGQKIFWLFMVIMICAGASEQAMSQWASAFAEAGLKVSKTVGDLAGPCAFALLMGSSRALYAKFSDTLYWLLCHSRLFRAGDDRTGRVCILRIFGGHFLARDFQHCGRAASRRGYRYVCPDGTGRGCWVLFGAYCSRDGCQCIRRKSKSRSLRSHGFPFYHMDWPQSSWQD